jgi:CheY-like chemotaxis protein
MNTSAQNSAPNSFPRQLLLVEDNHLFAEQITDAMRGLADHWQVTEFSEGLVAKDWIHQQNKPVDLVLVDLGLPDVNGIEVIRACRERFGDMPIVVISVVASEAAVLTASEAGRYTITLGRAVAALSGAVVTLIGPDDTAMTDAKGTQWLIRAETLSTDGVVYLQFIDSDSAADADVQDGARFTVLLFFMAYGIHGPGRISRRSGALLIALYVAYQAMIWVTAAKVAAPAAA